MNKEYEKNYKKCVDKYVKAHKVVHKKGSMIFAIATSAIAAAGITCGAIFIPKAFNSGSYTGPKIEEKDVNHSIEIVSQSDNYQLYTFKINSDKLKSENLSCFAQVSQTSGINISNELSVIINEGNIYTYLNYDSTDAAYGDVTKFNLVFTYSDENLSLAQTFSNFEIKYNQEIGDAELERDAYCYSSTTEGARELVFKNNVGEKLDPEKLTVKYEQITESKLFNITGAEIDAKAESDEFSVNVKYKAENIEEDETIFYNLILSDTSLNKSWEFDNLCLTATNKGVVPESIYLKTELLNFTMTVDLPEFDVASNWTFEAEITSQKPIADFVDGKIKITDIVQPTEENKQATIKFEFVDNCVSAYGRIQFNIDLIVKDENGFIRTRKSFEDCRVTYRGNCFIQSAGNPNEKSFDLTPNASLGLVNYSFRTTFDIPGDTAEEQATFLESNLIFGYQIHDKNNFIAELPESAVTIEKTTTDNWFNLSISLSATSSEITKKIGTSGTAQLYLVVGYTNAGSISVSPFRCAFDGYKLKVNYKNQ